MRFAFGEELGRDRGRDHGGLLAADLRHADRAGERLHALGRDAELAEALLEARPLRLRPDQPDKREPAGERLGRDGEVERMVMGHHQHERVRWRSADLGGRIVGLDWARIGGNVRREGILPGIDPADREGQRRQRQDQRPPDMAGAEEKEGGAAFRRFGRGKSRQAFGIAGVEGLDRERHAPAAALAEIGAERLLDRAAPARRLARAARVRRRERLPFELPAADRAVEGAVGAHDHAGAGLARGRAYRGMDGHERGGAVLRDDVGEAPPDGHGIAPPAHRLAGAQDRLRRRRRVERHGPIGCERMDRVGDRAEDRDRQHQRRLADRLGAVDRVLAVARSARARR